MVSAVDALGGLFLVLLLVVLAGAYFLPSVVAFSRHHHQAGAVFAINLLLGWTLIGWAVALAMALSAHRQPPVIVSQYVAGSGGVDMVAAGWYPDPAGSGRLRYWTGREWGPMQAAGEGALPGSP